MSDAPVAVISGEVVALSRFETSGRLEVRTSVGNRLYCDFDRQTDFERERLRVSPRSIAPGDHVEMFVDRAPGVCRARTVELSSLPRGPEALFQFGGLVMRVENSIMTVQTRAGDVRAILVPGTQFIGLQPQDLPNRHVFVRAGRNENGDLEAYQIVWGEIVQ
jgi:hypothetical protein